LFLEERLGQIPSLLRVAANNEGIFADEEHQNADEPLDLLGMIRLFDELDLVCPAQLFETRENLSARLELKKRFDDALFDLLLC